MKKIIAGFMAALAFSGSLFALDLSQSYSQMTQAYENKFYPGVLRYADEIIQNDRSGVYSDQAKIYKLEGLYKTGRSAEFVNFWKDLRISDSSKESAFFYWGGRFYLDDNKYSLASVLFDRCIFAKEPEELKNSAIYYGAVASQKDMNFEKAIHCYSYVLANGLKYQLKDYKKAAVEILNCYNSTKNYPKTVELAGKLEKTQFDHVTYNTILLLKGEGLEGLGKYRDAYDIYCSVLADGPENLSALAMQKAYYVSSRHKKEVGEEPGQIIRKAEPRLEKYPDLLSEFWARLAIDAFESGDYDKSRTYFASSQKGASSAILHLGAIYLSEMTLKEKNGTDVEKAVKAQSILDSVKVTPQDELYFNYNLSMARVKAFQKLWKESREFAQIVIKSKNNPLREQGKYWILLSYYQENDLKTCLKLVEEENSTPDNPDYAVLVAKVYAKNGDSKKADAIFWNLEEKGLLDNDGILDYTRTLLKAGYMISATEQSEKAAGGEAYYLAGIAAFNRGKWQTACEKFEKCQSDEQLSQKYRGYAEFYLGYCQYRSGEAEKAAGTLQAFAAGYGNHPLLWRGCDIGAKSAVQAKKYDMAFALAEKAVENAKTESERQSSVLLCAGIYADTEKFDEAVKTLLPYSKKNDSFGIECRFRIAQIQAEKKDYKSAEEFYLSVGKEVSARELGDEALYRYAELSYIQAENGRNELYQTAAERFEEYCSRRTSGNFTVAAQYYTACCYRKMNQNAKAKLYYEKVTANSKAETFIYGSLLELVSIYEEEGEYEKGIKAADELIVFYPDEAKKDGIPKAKEELYLLSKGGNVSQAKLAAEYQKAGEEKTFEGRKTGTELARSFFESGMTEPAEKLAKGILEENKKNIVNESQMAAENGELLAKILRNRTENKQSGELYLSVAQWYRNCGNEQMAAKALYSAAESFDAAAMYGDSKAVVEKIKEIYPDSQWSRKAEELLK